MGDAKPGMLLPTPPSAAALLVAQGGSVTSLVVAGLRPSCPWWGHGRLIQLLQIILSFKKKSPRAAGMRRWQKGHEPEGVRATHKPLSVLLCP